MQVPVTNPFYDRSCPSDRNTKEEQAPPNAQRKEATTSGVGRVQIQTILLAEFIQRAIIYVMPSNRGSRRRQKREPLEKMLDT